MEERLNLITQLFEIFITKEGKKKEDFNDDLIKNILLIPNTFGQLQKHDETLDQFIQSIKMIYELYSKKDVEKLGLDEKFKVRYVYKLFQVITASGKSNIERLDEKLLSKLIMELYEENKDKDKTELLPLLLPLLKKFNKDIRQSLFTDEELTEKILNHQVGAVVLKNDVTLEFMGREEIYVKDGGCDITDFELMQEYFTEIKNKLKEGGGLIATKNYNLIDSVGNKYTLRLPDCKDKVFKKFIHCLSLMNNKKFQNILNILTVLEKKVHDYNKYGVLIVEMENQIEYAKKEINKECKGKNFLELLQQLQIYIQKSSIQVNKDVEVDTHNDRECHNNMIKAKILFCKFWEDILNIDQRNLFLENESFRTVLNIMTNNGRELNNRQENFNQYCGTYEDLQKKPDWLCTNVACNNLINFIGVIREKKDYKNVSIEAISTSKILNEEIFKDIKIKEGEQNKIEVDHAENFRAMNAQDSLHQYLSYIEGKDCSSQTNVVKISKGKDDSDILILKNDRKTPDVIKNKFETMYNYGKLYRNYLIENNLVDDKHNPHKYEKLVRELNYSEEINFEHFKGKL